MKHITVGVADTLNCFALRDVQHAFFECARRGRAFTADDVRARLRPGVIAALRMRRGALGQIFTTAAKLKRIRIIGYRRSTTASRRKAIVAVWLGRKPR